MRILAVTNMYPSALIPSSGTFVEQQIVSLKQLGLDVAVMFVDRMQRGMRAYLGFGRKLRVMVAKFDPDIVHVMYGGVMADAVTHTINDRPTVVSFCGSDLLGENLSGRLRKLISEYGVRASHKAARRATGVVVKSKNLQDALPIYIPQSKVRVIPNGVDLERFQPLDRDQCREQLGWRKDVFHVLFPANGGDRVKRGDLAHAAIETLKERGISAQIHQLQGVLHNEVPIWLNASDSVLITSLHEGSPNILKEALACDVPVVSVDVGDVRERIKGIEGCYLSCPIPNDLAAKLSLIHSGKRRVAGRIKMQELSLERIAADLKSFYDDVVFVKNGKLAARYA
jgi:glycosyltransferase involved in cell wall biosynthesis